MQEPDDAFTTRLDPRAVPFVRRLADLYAWPSLKMTLLIGLGAALLSATAALVLVNLDPLAAFGVGLAALLTLAVSALGFGASVARSVAHDLLSNERRVAVFSDLPGWVLLQGYISAALYRLRLPLAFSLGLVPLLATGLAAANYLSIAVNAGGESVTLAPLDIAGPILMGVLVGLGLWGFGGLAAVIGTLEGLRPQPPRAAILRTALLLVVIFLLVTFGLALMRPVYDSPFSHLTPFTLTYVVFAGLTVMVAPFVITVLVIRPRSK